MSAAIPVRFARAERLALVGGRAAILLSALLAWRFPHALAPAYRCAIFACLGPPLGSALFLLVYKATGGQWGEALRPFLAAGLGLLPWVWLAALPVLFFPLRPGESPFGPSPGQGYFGFVMVAVRAALYGLIFFLLAGLMARAARPGSRRWLGSVGLIVMVFTLHLLAQDWIASLEPGWYSSGFPLVWMVGQAVSGLAAAILAAIGCGRHPPSAKGDAGRALGLDWGNLLLAAAMLWCYVAFAQFLIIWAGNLPAEISWFLRRSRGGWLAVVVALSLAHFLLPFLVLLSRRAKRSGLALGGVAGLLLLAQGLYCAWLILPAFPGAGAPAIALTLALLAALGGFLVNRYLAGARRLWGDA